MSSAGYLKILKISMAQEFVYKTNFIMWRVRNLLQILISYFLWTSVFADPGMEIFGYNRITILTYVFGVIIIRALVFSARSVDVPGEISDGSLSNYLVKPINYFKYWFIRDLSSKILNLAFSVVEFFILWLIFRPTLVLPTNLEYILPFIISLIIANYLIFVIRFIVSSITFWIPELAWGGQFLFMVIITEFLSGSIFPLDIFPVDWQNIFYFTPFPYLLFFPLQVFLGKISLILIFKGILLSLAWCVILTLLLKSAWGKGLKLYSGDGK